MHRNTASGAFSTVSRMWELRQVYTPQEQAAVYSRAGLYYELHEDYEHALGVLFALQRPPPRLGNAHPQRRAAPRVDITMRWKRAYYYAIPKEILRSPSLMRYEHAHVPLHGLRSLEMWYSALQEYAAPLKRPTPPTKRCAASLHISISPSRSAAAKASQRISATISKF